MWTPASLRAAEQPSCSTAGTGRMGKQRVAPPVISHSLSVSMIKPDKCVKNILTKVHVKTESQRFLNYFESFHCPQRLNITNYSQRDNTEPSSPQDSWNILFSAWNLANLISQIDDVGRVELSNGWHWNSLEADPGSCSNQQGIFLEAGSLSFSFPSTWEIL